jgi:para-nitrobenzyl esterase
MAAIARTTSGRIRGTEQAGSLAFLGVPFARPPLGALRFRSPVPPEPWDGVRDATSTACVAPQIQNPGLNAILPAGEEPQSEDCLYLNVWTPALDGARRPVMVWIHGGGFTIGSGSSPMYDGTALAERGDVVVVTINYRLGALGFLCLPASAGTPFTNFGMLDQIEALRWVQREIAGFGGDPRNVTIFGESAGGMSVGALLGSPLAEGLFHRAIPQSGAGHNALTPELARATAERFAKICGVASGDVDGLRALSVEKVLAAQAEIEAALMETLRSRMPPSMGFQPVIDGHFLDALPLDAVRAGRSRDVSLLIGTTGEEAKLFTAMVGAAEKLSDADLVRAFAARLGTDAAEAGRAVETYRRARRGRGEDASNPELYVAVDTDYMFRIPADRLASAQAAQQPRTYAYRFDWRSPLLGGALGAAHALELAFVFGTHGRPGLADFAGKGPEADRLAARVMDAWLAFARRGDPATDALPWPAYTTRSRTTMLLDRTCAPIDQPREPERQCWEGRR